jgi:hypothetical protein
MSIAAKILSSAVDVVETKPCEDIDFFIYPPSETDPFKMKECIESYRYGSRPDIQAKELRPNPIFRTSTAAAFDSLRCALENAVNHQGILPSAIISGPCGTGKSAACEEIARGGN